MKIKEILFIFFFLIPILVFAFPPAPKELSPETPQKQVLDGVFIPMVMDTSYRGTCTLYIPHGYKFGKQGFDLLIHFHTQDWLINQEFQKAGRKAIVAVINFPGLSDLYRIPFQTDTTLFQQVLDQIKNLIGNHYSKTKPRIHRLALSSFSAGYGAIREIIKQPAYYNQINDVLLVDSFYAGVVDTTSRDLEIEDVEPFAPMVRDAIKGKKTFVSTYCSLLPDTYAGTPETNRYLIAIASLSDKSYPKTTPFYNSDSTTSGKLLLQYDKGNFHVRGYTGITGVSHMTQVWGIKNWYELLPIGK